ncbi:hypothetical protein NW754_007771 [Fusarium falciforme]|nr:hypothetical protein NW754_007771 [Fusarium falciforme]
MTAQTMLSETLEELEHARTTSTNHIGRGPEAEESSKKVAALEADVKRLQTDLAGAAGAAGAAHAQVEERDEKITDLEADLKQLQADLAGAVASAGAAQSQIEDRESKIASECFCRASPPGPCHGRDTICDDRVYSQGINRSCWVYVGR